MAVALLTALRDLAASAGRKAFSAMMIAGYAITMGRFR